MSNLIETIFEYYDNLFDNLVRTFVVLKHLFVQCFTQVQQNVTNGNIVVKQGKLDDSLVHYIV